jgi:hypothetical protein
MCLRFAGASAENIQTPPAILFLSTRCAMLSGYTCIGRSRQWCCVNEKSRIQALDRTQPMLRLAAGIASVASLYDYVVGGGKY